MRYIERMGKSRSALYQKKETRKIEIEIEKQEKRRSFVICEKPRKNADEKKEIEMKMKTSSLAAPPHFLCTQHNAPHRNAR